MWKAPMDTVRPEGLMKPEGELVPIIPLVDNRPGPEVVQARATEAQRAALELLQDPEILQGLLELKRRRAEALLEGSGPEGDPLA